MMKRLYMLCYVVGILAFTLPAVSAEAAGPSLSESDTKEVISWIARQVSKMQQGYCYRQAYYRGVPSLPNTCNENENKSGLVCYTPCQEGFSGVGPLCTQDHCPADYVNMGAVCQRLPATEHLTVDTTHCPDGYHNTGVSCYRPWPPKSISLSNATCAPGLYQKGQLCFSECQPGFTNTGVACVRPPDTIVKKTYTRGLGSPMHCPSDKNVSEGACYTPCRAGTTGFGSSCWTDCPSGHKECGVGCVTNTLSCASNTVNMILSPVTVALNSARGVSEKYMLIVSAINSANQQPVNMETLIEAEKNAIRNAKKKATEKVAETVESWVNGHMPAFGELTTPLVNHELEARFRGDALTLIKRQYILNHLHLMLTRDVAETGLAVLKEVSLFDPTGISDVILAFNKPMCSSADPFPNVTIH